MRSGHEGNAPAQFSCVLHAREISVIHCFAPARLTARVQGTEELGVSGAMRFLMKYDPGHGDYTTERPAIFADVTLEEALRRIKSRNRAG